MKHHFEIKTKDLLVWKGWVVMSRSEAPLMKKAVQLLAKSQSQRVLEIGYGLGVSAEIIQEVISPKVHDILELDPQIQSDLREFARTRTGVRPIMGDFWEFAPASRYDLVFYDPFDFVDGSDDEDQDEQSQYGIDMAERLDTLLKPKGVFAWPHFAETRPPVIPGFRRLTKRLKVPAYLFQDGTETQAGSIVTWVRE
jgi:spermidine synthase